jgi:hypothetical protein
VSESDYAVTSDPIPEPPEGMPEPPPPPPETAKRSVRRPGRTGSRTGGKTGSTARKRPSTKKPPPGPSLEDGIRGLIQIPAAGCIMAGQRMNSLPLVADGATLLYHGPALAEATVQLAENDPRIMALLENLVKFGPYGMFVTVCFTIGVQISRNHELAAPPILESFGALPPEQIVGAAGMEIEVQVSPNGQRDEDVAPPAQPN